LSSLPFGVTATDPATFGQVAAVVAIISVSACAVPTARTGRLAGGVLKAE
jgi:hypothetical protein